MIDLLSIKAHPSLVNTNSAIKYDKMWFTVIWLDGKFERAKQVFASNAEEAIRIMQDALHDKYSLNIG
jgi:hypothetical protein